MKLQYGNQVVELFKLGVPNHIALSLSGGLDSASLFYLICKYYPNVKITPIIAVDAYAKFDALCALDVIGFMKETFTNHNIQETESFHFDHTDPLWLEKAQKLHDNGSKIVEVALKIQGTSKNIQMTKGFGDIRKKISQEYDMFGLTANPPDAIMKELGFFDIAEPNRNEPHNRPYNKSYPFANVDKKFIGGIYKDEGLMDTLYPITNSCVGMPDETDYGLYECGKCFWCHEKKWGFE